MRVHISFFYGKFKFTAFHSGLNVDILLLCEWKENKDIHYFPEILSCDEKVMSCVGSFFFSSFLLPQPLLDFFLTLSYESEWVYHS